MVAATLDVLMRQYMDRPLSIYRISNAVLCGKVIGRTPKISGSLQNSWNANNGEPVANNVNISIDNPRPLRNNYTEVINSLQLGDKFSLANGQPYVKRIEYEGWSSAKRPEGMLRVSVAEWDGIVSSAARSSM